ALVGHARLAGLVGRARRATLAGLGVAGFERHADLARRAELARLAGLPRGAGLAGRGLSLAKPPPWLEPPLSPCAGTAPGDTRPTAAQPQLTRRQPPTPPCRLSGGKVRL